MLFCGAEGAAKFFWSLTHYILWDLGRSNEEGGVNGGGLFSWATRREAEAVPFSGQRGGGGSKKWPPSHPWPHIENPYPVFSLLFSFSNTRKLSKNIMAPSAPEYHVKTPFCAKKCAIFRNFRYLCCWKLGCLSILDISSFNRSTQLPPESYVYTFSYRYHQQLAIC